MSSIVLLHCRNRRPIKGLVSLVKTINFSVNVMSPNSKFNSTVAIVASDCPLATILSNSDGGPSFKIVCGANNRSLLKSASGMGVTKHLCL